VGGYVLATAIDAAEPAQDASGDIRALREPMEEQDGRLEQARTVAGLESVTVSVSFVTVGQAATNKSTVDETGESQLNYRADVAVSLPVGLINAGDGELFAQVRAGQGIGLASLQPSYSATNATAFQLVGVSHADDSAALLAQAWYQGNFSIGGLRDAAARRVEVTFGKLDAFVFFDQNAVADDEASQFLNSAFVHNPLLDAGGDVGADLYGFQPGLRLAYRNETGRASAHGLSLGVFGAGSGAHFENTLSSPFSILQVESRRSFNGREGNYRLYAWRNGQAVPFNNPAAGTTEQHAGWGFSADQLVSENVTLFGRYGQEAKGRVQFDRAITAGAEFGGGAWHRARDTVGIAIGRLHTSDEFRAAAPTLDADGDGTPDFGYTPDGSESVYELYYRFAVGENVEITPDLQLIRDPAGNSASSDIKVLGLRMQAAF
jgi:high affinity Mn2+ porin